jgi:putative SOS response-associated peptidase YedK
MCFSYSIHHQQQALPFDSSSIQIPSPGFYFNGFNHPELPICSSNERWELAQWGLIPSWAQTAEQQLEIQPKTLNARSETAFEKPSFSKSWEQHPCIILSTGFFEWQHKGTQKIPHFIFPKSGGYLWFAGIFEDAKIQETWKRTFSILTTESRGIMSEIHHVKKRMPLMLTESELALWLHGSPQERRKWIQPRDVDFLTAHPINPNFNKNNNLNNTSALIEPYKNLQSQIPF